MANVNTIMTEEFDEYVKGLMAEFKVPGAAVALLTPSETNIKTFNLPNYPSITETVGPIPDSASWPKTLCAVVLMG